MTCRHALVVLADKTGQVPSGPLTLWSRSVNQQLNLALDDSGNRNGASQIAWDPRMKYLLLAKVSQWGQMTDGTESRVFTLYLETVVI